MRLLQERALEGKRMGTRCSWRQTEPLWCRKPFPTWRVQQGPCVLPLPLARAPVLPLLLVTVTDSREGLGQLDCRVLPGVLPHRTCINCFLKPACEAVMQESVLPAWVPKPVTLWI